MEFVETPTFWRPHVDPTACTNFSTRTFERRPPETRENLPFPFLSSPFPSFSLYGFFPFFSFLPSFPFLFAFLFLFLISHLISLSFLLIFSSSLVLFLPLFGESSFGQWEEIASSFPQTKMWLSLFPYLFFLFLYDIITHMASCEPWNFFSHTWLIVSHGIHVTHVAQCEPFIFMPSVTLLRCHVASPYLAMCHPTPHASKNVKSRPPQNSTKFDVVAKFRETISIEKSVSSSEI